ncbi:Leucine-rich repeat protein kinase family protein [Rhynchospora pubera]|uniref:Leucine-rich repeat protein kinase family protein n=1 Tax=Rhynchospora pubera TaxID=906938 RepID=A0AAV8HCD5_9POAL|nr:Leucine-rich repeat protein kinase family protein [Rhynchospora pubera]
MDTLMINFNYTNAPTYNISLEATSSSTLPPLLNAIELYTVLPITATTYAQDVNAIYSIKKYYKIDQQWSTGDPCIPSLWIYVLCTADSNNIMRITSLLLSSNGLTGSVSDHFGNLTALTSLYLHHNNLSGSIPNSLSQLTNLVTLDLSHNNLSGSLPKSLGQYLTRLESLYVFKLWCYNPTNPTPSPSRKKKSIIAIPVVVPLLVIAVATATAWWLKRKKYILSITSHPNESYDSNRQFSYNEIKRITNNFENNIGTGGYGAVYFGLLEDGAQVAVKVRSHSSQQGIKEFSAEARNLTRVHHRNLVSLMGYCIDKNCMAIVYEYMQEGNLQDKLKDNATPLSWIQRLRIVYESALGLEYLHQACNPPLIHRDVKTSNILLNANLEAKVADFGLSRAFNSEASFHVLTTVVGTIGYLDPEYFTTNQLSAKSDVFSFGIVLLEVITGDGSGSYSTR